MHHIIYLSQVTAPFGDAQLQALLARARATNAQHGITGVLLYGNDQFLQVLEGARAAVYARYDRIHQDPRHRDIIILADHTIERQNFASWHMAFAALPPQPFLELTSYSYLRHSQVNAAYCTQADAHLAHLLTLIRTFAQL